MNRPITALERVATKAKLAGALVGWLIIASLAIPGFGQAQKAARRSPVAPTPAEVQAAVNEAYAQFRNNTEGKNADYIPALAKVNPKLYGIAVVTIDGQTFTAGDVDVPFSMQSISKVFNLALAMEELGPETVFQKIGSEPTGRKFNSIVALEEMPGHTANPLVNPGAIATASLISGPTEDAKWRKILAFYSKAAGQNLSLLQDVYTSEAATNQRNKSIAMLLKAYDRMYSDPLEATDIYTKGCSVGVTAKQLAMMGATLANSGINPTSGEQVVKSENIPEILSSMSMAGLYDGSGSWAWHVGLPAKSGVGGGILAIAPGKGAIVVFAPPLDEAGNSVKAQKAITYFTSKLGIDIYSPRSVGVR